MIDTSQASNIRYVLSAKAHDAQSAYVERYLFYYVCKKLSFGDALCFFHLATSYKNINRNLYKKSIHI